jgi:hypothetical protein
MEAFPAISELNQHSAIGSFAYGVNEGQAQEDTIKLLIHDSSKEKKHSSK